MAQKDGGGDLQAWQHQMSEQGDQEAPESLADAMGEEEATRLRKCLQREVGFPSYSSFVRTRHGPDFKNLKRREKHFHCRCPTCAELTTRLHMAARNQESRVDFDKMLKAHYFHYFEVKH